MFRLFCSLNLAKDYIIQVVDRESAKMRLPNEVALALAGSNHRTICKFGDSENQRFVPVGDALEELVKSALGRTHEPYLRSASNGDRSL